VSGVDDEEEEEDDDEEDDDEAVDSTVVVDDVFSFFAWATTCINDTNTYRYPSALSQYRAAMMSSSQLTFLIDFTRIGFVNTNAS
jgi:hypothetical protein